MDNGPMQGSNSTGARTTIADVAREAGVSRTTVSHALSGHGHVEAGTRARVLAVADRLGYRPSARARNLRLGSKRAIALMSSMPMAVSAGPSRLGFFTEIAAAAAETALLHGCSLVLVPPVEAAAEALAHVDVDGVILVEPDADDALVRELRARRLPHVTIGRQPGIAAAVDPGAAPYVDLHAAQVARLLLDHLYQGGARDIALMLGASRRHSYVDAEHTYQAFCRDTGQLPRIVRVDERGGESAGCRATLQLIERQPRIDAICALVDAFATGALRALAQAGRRVPEDVMLATRYDGLRARLAQPPLTAVDLHLGRIAKAAVELLLRQLRGEQAPAPVAAPAASLVVRASTGRGHRRDGGDVGGMAPQRR